MNGPATRGLVLERAGSTKFGRADLPRCSSCTFSFKKCLIGLEVFDSILARIYALDGKSEEALKWLRITVKEGFPCYTLFARDSFLDPIRKDPAFIQFMTEMKIRWEGYRREFG
ncbi:hypothetical protein BH20ACI3_BH20ACI3_03260 [soil metagenome]